MSKFIITTTILLVTMSSSSLSPLSSFLLFRKGRSRLSVGVASAFTSSSSSFFPSKFTTRNPSSPSWQKRFNQGKKQQQQPNLSIYTTTSTSTSSLHQSTSSLPSPKTNSPPQPPLKINLHTIKLPELEQLMQSLSHPKYRAKQVLSWIRDKGVTNIDHMTNIPSKLKEQLKECTVVGSLELVEENVSNDGTKKRAYRLYDGQLIESVLMPYEDGRNTACISSQAGCAMGCVFCATGQMGFARQLTPDEIFEQVARFASELKSQNDRLSNVVMMGMGEPLANYRNVMAAIKRMNEELGIGARKITVSTVGVVPNIKKLYQKHKEEAEGEEEDVPQVRLAVSLHCATDEERTALLPANRRYGGLDELMITVKEYINTTKRRVTFEWALIENQNDTKDVARTLGRLLRRHNIRRDMVHINLIPLNPTGGFGGGRPSGRANVEAFVRVLEDEFGVKATPRMRRGIDIEAGCGQLKAAVKKREEKEEKRKRMQEENLSFGDASFGAVEELQSFIDKSSASSTTESPLVGVYEDDEEEDDDDEVHDLSHGSIVNFDIHETAVDLDDEEDDYNFVDPTYKSEEELNEAQRLINLVTNSFPPPPSTATVASPQLQQQQQQQLQGGAKTTATTTTTSITDEEAMREARRKRKKLLKNLKAIKKLREMELNGKELNEEQLVKIGRENEWLAELESVEHNLK